MSKGNTFENDFLKLVFQATAIANLADNAASSPLTSLYVSLHTADPGEAGDQTTNEATYTGYARVAVLRSASGFDISANAVNLHAITAFPACTASNNTITHFAIGTASSGAGKLLYSGTVTPNLTVANGVTPELDTSGTITED